MKPRSAKAAVAPPAAKAPSDKRRFRIEKLEMRIAPQAHYNPQTKLVGGGGNGGSGACACDTIGGSIY